jgi:hypothetical protein
VAGQTTRYRSDPILPVGFAKTDITPKQGLQSPGGMQSRRLNEVHDPLKAVATVNTNRFDLAATMR